MKSTQKGDVQGRHGRAYKHGVNLSFQIKGHGGISIIREVLGRTLVHRSAHILETVALAWLNIF